MPQVPEEPTRPIVQGPAGELTGQRLEERYALLELLGVGGFGAVYRAWDQRLERDVAIKVLSAGSDATGDARFLEEARAMARLRHPAVVQIHDAGQSRGLIYLVMEYVDGEPLRRRLVRGALPLELAVGIARGVATALAAAHGAGMVHRDVKPENVLLTGNGEVKLADLGLARLFDRTGRSVSGAVSGTPGYMAPEQIEGRPVGPAADLFALGCVIQEMLTGSRPFSGHTPSEVLARILAGRPDRLPDGAATPQLRDLVARLIARDPSRRPASAALVAEALTLDGQERTRPLPSSRPPRRRGPLLLAIPVALLALGLAAAVALYVVSARRTTPAPGRVVGLAVLSERAGAVLLPPDDGGEQRVRLVVTGERPAITDGATPVSLGAVAGISADLSATGPAVRYASSADAAPSIASAFALFEVLRGQAQAARVNHFTTGRFSDVHVDCRVRDVPAAPYLLWMARAAGWSVAVDRRVVAAGTRVTASLEDVPWDMAAVTLIEMGALKLFRHEHGWLLTDGQGVDAARRRAPLVAMFVRFAKVDVDSGLQGLLPAASEEGVLVPNLRLGAVFLFDRTWALPGYEDLVGKLEDGARLEPATERSAGYGGKPIDVHLDGAPLSEVFEVLGRFSGLNMVVTPAVDGPVYAHLVDVPWDEAMELLIESAGADYRFAQSNHASVIRVAPPDDETAELRVETVRLEREEPEFFQFFARLVTPRGSFQIEPATRTLVIRDLPNQASLLRQIAERIDGMEP